MATITDSPSSTYGLASQLRTPPPPSPGLYGSEAGCESSVLDIAPISAKKVTPAMREDFRRSPKITGTPAWISRSDSSTRVQKVHAAAAVRSSLAASTKSDADGEVVPGRHNQDSQALRSSAKAFEDDNSTSSKTPLLSPELIHITKPKFSLNAQRTGPPPPRPIRPSSPPFLASALESSTSLGAIPGGEQNDAGPIGVSFPSLGSLDLGIQFDETAGAFYSTFRPAGDSQRSSAKTLPNESQDIEIPAPVPTVGTTSAILATVDRSDVFTSSAASHDTPIQGQSPKLEPATPIVEKVKSNRPSPAQASGPFPTNTASPKSSISSKMSSSFVAPNKLGRLPGNLLPLARRTAHISDTVGYAWRLALLEKLEAITGSFLTIEDAEAILSIGANPASKAANLANHRKSLIEMPIVSLPPQRKLHKSNNRSSSSSTTEVAAGPGARSTFFNKMKRALGAPVAESEKTDASNKTQLSKGIFGVPLTVAAEYGFVASMIAGQRHELPGVCFSAVEEIYRRGHGMNVPGLLVNPGETSRVAKLVAIYNTAPEYGEQHDLSIESIHNVTALLKKYLRDLPEPVLDQRLWKLFLAACVYSTNSIKVRVTSAQVILRLLPTPNFSLLVYMVAFLSQIPLFPENRISLESVSHIVGAMLMSPRDPSPQSQSKGSKLLAHITGPTDKIDSSANAKRAEEALLWLLTHWSLVADGLLEPQFDIDVDAVLDRDTVASSTRSNSPSHLNDDTEQELDGAADPLRFLPNDALKKSVSQSVATSSRATLLIAPSAKAKVEYPEIAQVKPQLVEPEIQRGTETEEPRAPDTPTKLEILPRLHSGSVPGGPAPAETPDVLQYSQDTPVNARPVERVVSTFADSDVTSRRVSAKTMTPMIFHWEPPTKGGSISHQKAHKPKPIQIVAEEEYEDVPPPTPAKEVAPYPYGARTSTGPPPSQDLPTTPMSDDTVPMSPTAAIHQVTSRDLQEDFLIAGVNDEATPVPSLDDERRGTSLSSSVSSAQEGALTPFSSARSDSILASYSMDRSARNSKSSRKSMNSANEFSRAHPEDAYGPVGMDESVLDDLMDFDDDTSSAVLKFPSPPGSTKTQRLSELPPTVLDSIARMQATRRTSRASVSSQSSAVQSGPRGLPRLVDADQLDEAKRTIDAQRVEITDLWKQMTDLETQREADRHHLSTLQMQILELRTAGQAKVAAPQVDEKQIHAEWEVKFAEQSKAAQEQLEASKIEFEEARRIQDDESKKQIASLSSQLDAIRSLLMAGMAGGVLAS